MTEVIEALWSLARVRGPLRGPLQDESDRAVLTQGDPVLATTRVLEALRYPEIPPGVVRGDLEIVASDVFGELLQPAVETVLRQSLGDPAARPAVLRTFAFGCSEESVDFLVELVRSGRVQGWKEDELVLLVDALWTSGSEKARSALKVLADMPRDVGALQNELDKALDDLS